MELSAFDLDDTLIEGNSSASFCKYLYRHGEIPLSVLMYSLVYSLRHRFFGMTLAELHHSVFNRLLLGKPFAMLEKYIDKFVDEYVQKSLYLPAFIRLRRAQQLGHYTMILSNAPDFLVAGFAKILGVNSFQATEYHLDEERKFEKIFRILEGKDKARLILNHAKKLGILLEKITAYSDSVHDLEFLQVAGNPIAVNPDKKLRAISLENQWSII